MLWLVVAAHVVASEPCKDCWTAKCAELRDLGLPACVEARKPPKPALPETCEAGKYRSVDTQGHCCWPGQAHNGAKCVGKPSSCPPFLVVDDAADQCVLPACDAGMVRSQDKVHCCWPDQAWSTDTQKCIGRPACAKDFTLEGDTCTSNATIAARTAAEQAAAAEKARLEQATREAAEAAERARLAAEQAKRDQAARLERERQEAARQKAAQEKRAHDDAIRAQRLEIWESDKAAAGASRLIGYGAIGGGALALLGVGGMLYVGASQNDVITKGGLATATDIQGAADLGFAANVFAWILGVGGGAVILGGVGWVLLNLDPAEPDMSDLGAGP